MEKNIFKDFDFSDFWDDSEYSLSYINESPTDELFNSIEQELGYKLPSSYIELMKLHNGGIPKNRCVPTAERTSWAEDHCVISGIFGIGRTKNNSLCGSNNQFWIDEWGYPNTGIYICDCPSAGHDMIMLDYSKCGKDGEPEVIHVDVDCGDFTKTFLAKNFETFIRGLANHSVYDTSTKD
jgi:SMI1-KNR4 cell-wall